MATFNPTTPTQISLTKSTSTDMVSEKVSFANVGTIKATTLSSDNLVIGGKITATEIVNTGTGSPTISSNSTIDLNAQDSVRVNTSVFKLATMSQGQIDSLVAQTGDLVFNSTVNKFQGYHLSGWVNLN
jgi:hypothetical protein